MGAAEIVRYIMFKACLSVSGTHVEEHGTYSEQITKYQQPSLQPELSRGRVSTTAGSARYVATARDKIPIAAILGDAHARPLP